MIRVALVSVCFAMAGCGGGLSSPDLSARDASTDDAGTCGHETFPAHDLGSCRAYSQGDCTAGQYVVVCGVNGPFAADAPPANCTIDPPNPGGETIACCPCL